MRLKMKNRDKITFEIPVPEDSTVQGFCQRPDEDPYHSMIIAEQVSAFVNKNKILPYEVSLYYFKELVKNAYDAYALKGLEVGKNLVLEVITEAKEEGIYVKIKDNGCGFPKRKKGEQFQRSKVEYYDKGYEQGFIGGQHIGLTRFEEEIQSKGGQLSFKNRNKGGASVIMFFKAPQANLDAKLAMDSGDDLDKASKKKSNKKCHIQ